jgi:FKBP-type peptidyl-prolyl cis-trans isomerase
MIKQLFTASLLSLTVNSFALELKTDTDKLSYTFGASLGKSLKKQEVELNLDILSQGIQDVFNGKDTALSEEDMQQIISHYQQQKLQQQQATQEKQAEENQKAGEAFLAENAKKEGVKVLPSGLQYKVLTQGKGKTPKATDTVVTHYKGTLIDGTEFDSSISRGKPALFPVNQVIKGWTEALQLMKEGDKWQLFVPAQLGYGAQGTGHLIGPNATLIFEVELIEVK